jgi:alpha-ribazole phosphatase/probable phosphoglycerate mutase
VTHLLLIRHAETDLAGRFCGHSDPELNERGRQQLEGLVNALSEHGIRRVYTSDLRRAQQTAEAIANHFGAGFHIRPALREIHFGLWEGLSWNEIEVRDPVRAKRWAEEYPNSTAPGGESFHQFESRVRKELAFLLAEATNFPIATVAHAGFIRVALTKCCKVKVSQQEAWDRTKDYGSVVALDTDLVTQETQL